MRSPAPAARWAVNITRAVSGVFALLALGAASGVLDTKSYHDDTDFAIKTHEERKKLKSHRCTHRLDAHAAAPAAAAMCCAGPACSDAWLWLCLHTPARTRLAYTATCTAVCTVHTPGSHTQLHASRVGHDSLHIPRLLCRCNDRVEDFAKVLFAEDAHTLRDAGPALGMLASCLWSKPGSVGCA